MILPKFSTSIVLNHTTRQAVTSDVLYCRRRASAYQSGGQHTSAVSNVRRHAFLPKDLSKIRCIKHYYSYPTLKTYELLLCNAVMIYALSRQLDFALLAIADR